MVVAVLKNLEVVQKNLVAVMQNLFVALHQWVGEESRAEVISVLDSCLIDWYLNYSLWRLELGSDMSSGKTVVFSVRF